MIQENPWWQYWHDAYEKSSGEIGHYYYGKTWGSVVIIPVLPDGRIVMIQQYRYLFDRQSIEFPAGGRKKNEPAEEAARRELLEETGFPADEMIKISSFQPLNGFIDDDCHVFIARVSEDGVQHLEETEEIEVIERRPDEIDAMIQNQDIWDGTTLAAWAMTHSVICTDNAALAAPLTGATGE